MKTIALTAALLLAAAPGALAQDAAPAAMDHSAMDHGAPSGSEASTAAFEAVNARMHENMAVERTGDADVDFVRSMIPHHQGAIDMARIVLEHGDDPELQALAEGIVEAQEREIAEMRAWLEANAPQAAAPAQ